MNRLKQTKANSSQLDHSSLASEGTKRLKRRKIPGGEMMMMMMVMRKVVDSLFEMITTTIEAFSPIISSSFSKSCTSCPTAESKVQRSEVEKGRRKEESLERRRNQVNLSKFSVVHLYDRTKL